MYPKNDSYIQILRQTATTIQHTGPDAIRARRLLQPESPTDRSEATPPCRCPSSEAPWTSSI
ncbi:hypothetical protein C8Q80DRAFT_1153032 [Daedaleopsis nitida]|nr:hypothetical protein C8Q80DRAFT_1153032 [Daedaleopsis nitida]